MSEQYCYCLDNDHLIINIKTGYDVDKVFIIYGDPYEAGIMGGNERWSGKREEICFKKRDASITSKFRAAMSACTSLRMVFTQKRR